MKDDLFVKSSLIVIVCLLFAVLIQQGRMKWVNPDGAPQKLELVAEGTPENRALKVWRFRDPDTRENVYLTTGIGHYVSTHEIRRTAGEK